MIGDVSQNNKIHAYILFFICIMRNRNGKINLSIYITTRLVDLSVLLISFHLFKMWVINHSELYFWGSMIYDGVSK